MPGTDPFLRWAGGKSWMIKHLDTIMGNFNFNHYHEPFLGGAAIFFSLNHHYRAYLSDMNPELVDTYIAVRDFPLQVIEIFQSFPNTEQDYYRIRTQRYPTQIQKAAQFIYLNQMSYNGLYRVNKSGQYNVPYGFRSSFKYDTKRIIDASNALKNTNIKHGDFEINKYTIKEGDLIFLDPPYTVSHNNNGFIEYNRNLFSLDDQYRLSKYIDYIKNKGAFYILTNAAHAKIEEIFNKGDQKFCFNRHSLIGGTSAKREMISEFIFTNIPGGNIL